MFKYLKDLFMPSRSALAYSTWDSAPDNEPSPYSRASIANTQKERSPFSAENHERLSQLKSHNDKQILNCSFPVSSVIGVIGAKGGVGATTLAINLALGLAQKAGPTTLVDANLQQPDAALMLGKTLPYSLADLIAKAPNLTSDIVDACRTTLQDKIKQSYLLSPPTNGEALLKIGLSEVVECIEAIRHTCRYWLIDLPNKLDRHLVTALDRIDLIVLVLEPTATALGAARRWTNVFNDLGYSPQKTVCILNRACFRLKNIESEAKGVLANYQVLPIPNAFALAEKTFLTGEPGIVREPKAPYSKAVSGLAVRLAQMMEKTRNHE